MQDTETSARRLVRGGELFLRRRPGAQWEINYWWRDLNPHTARFEGVLRSQQLFAAQLGLEGATFATPDEAVLAVEEQLAA